VTRLPGEARCAMHMTASASCERDSASGVTVPASMQCQIVFDGYPAIGEGRYG
jgi:hypothetical protein